MNARPRAKNAFLRLSANEKKLHDRRGGEVYLSRVRGAAESRALDRISHHLAFDVRLKSSMDGGVACSWFPWQPGPRWQRH